MALARVRGQSARRAGPGHADPGGVLGRPGPTVSDRGAGGLAVAVGGRADAPAPAAPDQVGELIDQAVADGTGINVIRVDGQPSIACALSFRSDAANPVAKADDLNRFKQQPEASWARPGQKEPEANPLQALVLASHAAGPGGPLILLDSGLQTVALVGLPLAGLAGRGSGRRGQGADGQWAPAGPERPCRGARRHRLHRRTSGAAG